MTTTITISNSPGNPTPIAFAGDPPTLFANMSSNDTILISNQQSFTKNTPQVVTLSPGAFVVISPVDDLYAACSLNGTQMEIIPGGLSYAAPGTVVVNLSGINQNVNGNYQITEPSGLVGTIPIDQTDDTLFGATGTGATPITKAYNIPLNDAFVNTVYKISSIGLGTQGTTADSFHIGTMINGVAQASFLLPTTLFPASHGFQIYAELNCHITVTGAAGNADYWGFVNFYDTTSGNSQTYAFFDNTNTFDTLIANTYQLYWQWVTITGAPSVTFYKSIFSRWGP